MTTDFSLCVTWTFFIAHDYFFYQERILWHFIGRCKAVESAWGFLCDERWKSLMRHKVRWKSEPTILKFSTSIPFDCCQWNVCMIYFLHKFHEAMANTRDFLYLFCANKSLSSFNHSHTHCIRVLFMKRAFIMLSYFPLIHHEALLMVSQYVASH